MKKLILILIITLLLFGCTKKYEYIEGIVIRKEIINNTHYFIMEYELDNIKGYNAMINVSEEDYYKYELEELYIFRRPIKKE
jgi:hypothetical protein